MPQTNGFDLLELTPERNFQTIFITAYDKYAIKAFKYSAIDYILKPIDIEEFINAVNRALKMRNSGNSHHSKLDILFDNLKAKQPFKLSIPSNKGYEYVNTNDIIRIEADGRYSIIHLKDSSNITVTKLISELIETIDDSTFYRPHKSHFINLNYVKKFVKTDGNYIEMEDGAQVAIARNKKDEFLKVMKNTY